MLLRLRWVIGIVLLELSAVSLQPQTSEPETIGPMLKSTARLVVVDVVVTDANGQPVPGLRREDFRVFENGKPQTISVFEEHDGKAPAAIKQAELPPNTFSNSPGWSAPESLNVVLLDALNTPIHDQSLVHQQVLKYLASMHAGEPMAIFILSTRLRLVQGFTSDLDALLAALHDKKSRSSPQSSPLLRSGGEIHAEEQAIGEMQSLAVFDPDVQGALDALRQFQAEEKSSQTGVRVVSTLDELRQLGQYLSAFPGRKNVIWFSGAFPLNIFQGPSKHLTEDRDFLEEVRHTADVLTRARVAIYPVEAGGLAADPMYDASALPLNVTGAYGASEAQSRELQNGSMQRTASQSTMEEMAKDTGGKAFYNTNGMDEVLAQAIRDGSRYYTLDYTPADWKMDGEFRRIQVKVRQGHYKLAYRRGYMAEDQQRGRAVAGKPAAGDPLQPLMASGLPNFAQILYLMSVKPTTPQPAMNSPRAGDNKTLEGAFTRMGIDLAISEKTLQMESTADGLRDGTLEVTLIAYDHYGNPLNWLIRNIKISLPPDRYRAYWDVGLQFHFEFDAPRGAAYLRSGVCDLTTGKAGTMEVLLSEPSPVPLEAGSK